MTKNYRQLIESVKGRINPEHFAIKKSFSDELSTISYSEVLTYIRLVMKGVEPEYTQKSKDAGENPPSMQLHNVISFCVFLE